MFIHAKHSSTSGDARLRQGKAHVGNHTRLFPYSFAVLCRRRARRPRAAPRGWRSVWLRSRRHSRRSARAGLRTQRGERGTRPPPLRGCISSPSSMTCVHDARTSSSCVAVSPCAASQCVHPVHRGVRCAARVLRAERAAQAEELAAARKSLAELQESIAARERETARKVGHVLDNFRHLARSIRDRSVAIACPVQHPSTRPRARCAERAPAARAAGCGAQVTGKGAGVPRRRAEGARGRQHPPGPGNAGEEWNECFQLGCSWGAGDAVCTGVHSTSLSILRINPSSMAHEACAICRQQTPSPPIEPPSQLQSLQRHMQRSGDGAERSSLSSISLGELRDAVAASGSRRRGVKPTAAARWAAGVSRGVRPHQEGGLLGESTLDTWGAIKVLQQTPPMYLMYL